MSRLVTTLFLSLGPVASIFAVASGGTPEGGNGGDGAQPGGGQEGAQPPADPGFGSWILPLFLVLIGFMLWSSFRAQKKEKQKLQNLISELKIGDRIETIGGLRGEVVRQGEGEFDIKTGGDNVITIAAGAVKQSLRDDDRGDKDKK